MIAKVLIDNGAKKLNRVYDYLVKPEHEMYAEIGKRVSVNFGQGKGSQREGIIVKLDEASNSIDSAKLKAISEILDSESYLDESRLKLAKWIAKMYFCNVYTALKLMLPPSSGKLNKKEINGKQITVITLATSKENILDLIENKKITSANHIRLLKEIIDNPELPVDDAINSLKISKAVIKKVEQNGYITLVKKDVSTVDYSNIKRTDKFVPTEEQKRVIGALSKKLENGKFDVSLLLGVTGSGKTEVYLQLIEKCLELGKTAIVLVPEISLTDQTKRRFISRFGDIVSVLHSKMTILEKQSEYKRIVKGEAKIVIGPRSALFVPLKNIGIIIMDEEHDTSYISQSTPKYNAKEVATRIAYDSEAILLLGSATPDICTMYKARAGKIGYYEMLTRPSGALIPSVEIVDMKQDILNNTSRLLSNRLKEEIAKNIANKEQTFIYLNRRGYSSYIVCSECGKALRCPNCDVNLTYHKKRDLLLCHYCSYCEKLTNVCPHCGKQSLIESGTGTEKVEQEIEETFPGIKVARMDMDTTIKRGSHEKILNKFKEENIDVLVGTQMISKGHDIENVTLVGVINADYMAGSDYSVAERAFSNLLQVVGRAGRGKKKGRAILQAYDMDNYIIDAVAKNSYFELYDKEIVFRQMAGYPPFVDVLVIELNGKNQETVVKDGKKLYDILSTEDKLYKIYSPQVPFVGKINNSYRIQVVIKTVFNNKVLDLLYEKLAEYDKIKPKDINISIVKNPVKLG